MQQQGHKINPHVTTQDGDLATDEALKYDPNYIVRITINGISVGVGDGHKNEACYFSSDGGSTASRYEEIKAGDKLYWNGSIAGYELESSDEIRFLYDVRIIETKKWHQKAWIWITAFLGAIALIFAVINDGHSIWNIFFSTNSSSGSLSNGEIIAYTKPLMITTDEVTLDVYKPDTIQIEITGGEFVLLDSVQIAEVKFLSNEYLYNDPYDISDPKITILNYRIEKRILNKEAHESSIATILELDLIPDPHNVAWFERGKIINLAEVTYRFWYKQNNVVRPVLSKNLIQLTKPIIL